MQIKPQTLIAAIQCVAAQTHAIDERLNDDSCEHGAELEQLLLTFDLAAEDLKAAYLLALEQFSGLPSYETLLAHPL